jgi:hypothetical protein
MITNQGEGEEDGSAFGDEQSQENAFLLRVECESSQGGGEHTCGCTSIA